MGRQGNNTRRQEILDAIETYRIENGCAPTMHELCDAVGLSSTSTMHGYLHRMREDGLVDWQDGTCRTLHVVRDV